MGKEWTAPFRAGTKVPTTIPRNRVSGLRLNKVKYTEAWMSGLNQQFTKLSALNWAREFESHRLRSKNLVSADPST